MGKSKRRMIEEILTVLAGLLIAFLPAPEGLSIRAMHFLGIFAWVILNWILSVMPSYIAGLIMLLLTAAFGIVPFRTAFSAFSGPTVWLIVGVLALGGAVNKTGLLSRLSLLVMSIFPASFRGQTAGLILAGILLGPFMPSTTAKVSIAGGLSTKIGEILALASKSKGADGIFASMYTGFTLLAPTFITSSYYSYVMLGLISADEGSRFTFSFWLISMIPWCLFTAFLSFVSINMMYGPKESSVLSKDEIRLMYQKLGPISINEKITLSILTLCILGWVLEKVIGLPTVITALGGMCLLFASGVLSPKDITERISWGTVIFCASVLSLAPILTEAGINEWLGNLIGSRIGGIGRNPYFFILTVTFLTLLCRFVIVGGSPVISLMVVILTPFCEAAGINPWVSGIAAYTAAQPFFLKYQNSNFIVAYEAAGGDEKLDFPLLIPYSFVYHFIAALGLLFSVPWWQYLGIIE